MGPPNPSQRSSGSVFGAFAGVAIFAIVDGLLWRAVLVDFAGSGPDAWLVRINANNVTAAVGFAVLLACLAAFAIWEAVQGPSKSSRAFFAFATVLCVGGVLLGGRALTDRIAAAKGFQRCAPLDQFRAGNVRRNDTIARAYVRVDSAPPSAPSQCGW